MIWSGKAYFYLKSIMISWFNLSMVWLMGCFEWWV